MALQCFICNTQVGQQTVADSNDLENFQEYIRLTQTVTTFLGEILDKRVLNFQDLHSSVICKECYNTAMEFDNMKKRLKQIKTELIDTFTSTLTEHGYTYSLYPFKAATAVKLATKIVLPASKLHPVPADFVIDINKIPKSMNVPTPNITINESPSPTKPNKLRRLAPTNETVTSDDTVETNIANSLSSILGVKTSTSMTSDLSTLTFNINAVTDGADIDGDVKTEVIIDDDDEHNVEEPMEIDEGNPRTVVLNDQDHDLLQDEQYRDDENQEYVTAELLPVSDEFDNEEETETIVMRGDNGAILRLVTGQKLVYENGQLTLADDDSSQGEERQEGEGHDSNDESQIELQVSGDEETANAIIAAAQEHGGAFIKVESGEMFRVKSVKSKSGSGEGALASTGSAGSAGSAGSGAEEAAEVGTHIQFVTVIDNQFHCLLCEEGKTDYTGSPKKRPESVSLNAEEMMQHLRARHDARAYLCQLCKKVLKKRSEYSAHLVEHSKNAVFHVSSDKRVHECAKCHKKYNSKTLLQEHMNTHSGSKPHTCAVCNKAFASKYTHRAHLKTHLERPRPYKCPQCPKSFLSQQNQLQHEKTHLGLKQFRCNVCGKAFSTQHNLEVHGVVHSGSKPFVCGVCGKAFARKAEIRDHMRVHTGERPFACEVCGAAFKQRSNLLSHKRATHLNDKRYQCEECPKRFKRRRLLDYHIKACHTGERPLQCEVCHATFVYPEHYKKHARIHSGEKPYVCEVCGKSFNSRDNRNTHRFVHSDKKPYECLVCGAGYMRKQLLYAHMNTSNHLAESIVVNQPRVQKMNSRRQHTLDIEAHTTVIAQDEEVPAKPLPVPQDAATDADSSSLLTLIQSLDGPEVHSVAAGTPVQMVTADETGAIRLVQLHLNAPATWTLSAE